jgi:hypothetical protein
MVTVAVFGGSQKREKKGGGGTRGRRARVCGAVLGILLREKGSRWGGGVLWLGGGHAPCVLLSAVAVEDEGEKRGRGRRGTSQGKRWAGPDVGCCGGNRGKGGDGLGRGGPERCQEKRGSPGIDGLGLIFENLLVLVLKQN